MKYFLLVLVTNSCLAQEKLPLVEWNFLAGSTYSNAFSQYLIETNQNIVNSVNFDHRRPEMGIYLIHFFANDSSDTETMTIRYCLDDSWKNDNFDYYFFYGSKLLLIDRGTGKYPSAKDWEVIIQDRVFQRKKESKRKLISSNSIPRTGAIVVDDVYAGWYHKGDQRLLLQKAPYYLRKVLINHSNGKIKVAKVLLNY